MSSLGMKMLTLTFQNVQFGHLSTCWSAVHRYATDWEMRIAIELIMVEIPSTKGGSSNKEGVPFPSEIE